MLAVLDYTAHPAFTPAERAALAYAEGMTRTPVEMPGSVFGELKKHYDTPVIVEISVFAAYQNFNAKFNGALEVEINAFCSIPFPGVTPGKK